MHISPYRDSVGFLHVAACSEQQVPPVGGCARRDRQAG